MDPFSRPEGDPGTISASAAQLRGVARDLASQTISARSQVGTVADAAKGKRSLSFRAAGEGVVAQLDDAATCLGALAGLLDEAAENLHEVITDVAEYKRRAEAAEEHADEVAHGLEADDPKRGEARRHAAVRREHFEDLALDAKHRYRRQAQATAAQVDAITDRVVPDGHGLTPDDIRATLLADTGISGLGEVSSLSERDAWGVLDYWVHANVRSDWSEALGTSLVAAMSPAQVAKWWQSLTPIEQMRAIQTNPMLGNVDGVAYWARDLTNRSQISIYQDQLNSRRKELEKEIADGGLGMTGGLSVSHELAEIDAKLDSLDEVESLLDDKHPDHHLIGLDLSHDRAQAIVGQGDLDTASRVAVFTPGLKSTVQGMGSNDKLMRGARADAAKDLAAAMSPAEIRAAGGPTAAKRLAFSRVATVTWLDYQAPQIGTIPTANSVLLTHAAKQGGDALADFYRGIYQSRTQQGRAAAEVAAMAHSYGTPTLGFAEQQRGLHITRSLMIESPGPSVDDIKKLHVPAGQSYFAEGASDIVADAGMFGADPSYMDGTKHLETGVSTNPIDGTPLAGSNKHSLKNYLEGNTTTRYNVGKFIAGQTDEMVYGNNVGFLDGVREGLFGQSSSPAPAHGGPN